VNINTAAHYIVLLMVFCISLVFIVSQLKALALDLIAHYMSRN